MASSRKLAILALDTVQCVYSFGYCTPPVLDAFRTASAGNTGFEPVTLELTAPCSAVELITNTSRNLANSPALRQIFLPTE